MTIDMLKIKSFHWSFFNIGSNYLINVIETFDILKADYIHAHVKKATRKWNDA